MKNYEGVFKSYDIRSLYNDPLDESFCRSLGKALGKHLVEKYGENASCVLGSDCRMANLELIVALVSGLAEGGCTDWNILGCPVESREEQVHPYGVTSSALLYWTVFEQFDLGVALTASHNPPERVGMKNADRSASLIPSGDLKNMIETYERYPYAGNEDYFMDMMEIIVGKAFNPDDRIVEKIESYYTDILLPVFKNLKKEYTITVDYSGGAACGFEKIYLQKLVEDTGLEVIHYNDKADSFCSEHLSDTSVPKNYEKVGLQVRENGSILGVMFDGDADRLGVVNGSGEMVLGDRLVALISTAIVKENKGGTTIYDITSTNDIKENVHKVGGKSLPSRMGYRYVKALMKEHDALFGGESSGHLLFPETGYAESPLLALGYILRCVDEYETLSATLDTMVTYHKPPLRNYHVDDKDGVIARVTELYGEYDLDFMDGVRVNGEDRWFIVRKSNSEPLLRVFVEGKSEKQCEKIFEDIEKIIESMR